MRKNKQSVQAIMLLMLALFTFTTAASQIETSATQTITINGGRWTKVLKKGDPVTIFSYKQNGGIHSLGIYSDDYAGVIDMQNIPFNVEQKALKKLPKNSKKMLSSYTEKACVNARKKAFEGKYQTIAPEILSTRNFDIIASKNDPILVLGYKAVKSISGVIDYYFAVFNKDGIGVCDLSSFDNFKMNNVPLPFLPSTDDPQIKSFIAKVDQAIKERKAAEERVLEEKVRKQREEKEAQRKALEVQEFEDLKLMDPAYIEVKKIKMDSAGGNEVTIKFTNCSSLRIKYVYFTGYFFNAVGDKCRNEINGSTVLKFTGVGPVSRIPNTPDRYGPYIKYFHSDPLFYSKTAQKFRLSSVTIEYMNGKKVVLSGDELEYRVDYTDY